MLKVSTDSEPYIKDTTNTEHNTFVSLKDNSISTHNPVLYYSMYT